MNAAGLDVRTEKPVTKQSVGKIWEKLSGTYLCRHLIPERDIFFKVNGKSWIISVTDIKDIICQWDFLILRLRTRAGKCTDFGIPAVLYDKTRIPDSCQRKDISG